MSGHGGGDRIVAAVADEEGNFVRASGGMAMMGITRRGRISGVGLHSMLHAPRAAFAGVEQRFVFSAPGVTHGTAALHAIAPRTPRRRPDAARRGRHVSHAVTVVVVGLA